MSEEKEMKEYIESVTPVTEIDYLVMDHTEPDHAGTVEKLLEINPSLTIVATGTAIQFLKHIVNADFNSIAVKENDTLSLGDLESGKWKYLTDIEIKRLKGREIT